MKYYTLMFLVVLCNTAANLTLKSGANLAPSPFLLNIFSWRSMLGLGLFGAGAILYLAALRIGSLSISQSIAALQYVGVLLGARLLFAETFTSWQLFGCFLLCIGIFFVMREA